MTYTKYHTHPSGGQPRETPVKCYLCTGRSFVTTMNYSGLCDYHHEDQAMAAALPQAMTDFAAAQASWVKAYRNV